MSTKPTTKTFGKSTREVPAAADKAKKWYNADDETDPKKVSLHSMPPSLLASTRRPPSVEVFEDLDASAQHNGEPDVEAALLSALGPLSDASNKQNVQLNPTTSAASGSSPKKADSSPLRPISSHSLSDIKIPPPPQPNFTTDSPQKNGNFYTVYQ